MYALTNGKLYTERAVLHDHALIVNNGCIQAILPKAQLASDCPQIDLHGWHISPGFIDLQLNGCGGVMFNDAIAPNTLDTMHQTNLRSGTTSFLPTLITTTDEDIRTAMDVVHQYRQTHLDRVLGLHLEGPYLNPKRKGIHNGKHVRSPDTEIINAIIQAGPETVRLITLAPEMVASPIIQSLNRAGIVVSAGHTNANFDHAQAGFEAGISMVTHLFNAMSPWQSRNPGMVGAALAATEVYAGIIADGHHVHFTSVALAKKLKKDKLILVTDATPPAGADLDAFMIGGQEVFYREGKCVSAEGTLGGSALTMIEAITNCVHHVGIPLDEALRMATLYPAKAIQLDHQMGRLAPNYSANLAIFDNALNVVAVVDRGRWKSFSDRLTVNEQPVFMTT